MAGIDQSKGVRMAEWLRPGLWEVLTIKSRGIEPGQVLTHKKSIDWADGTEVTSRRYYGRRKPIFRGQDGRVVKAPSLHSRERTKYTPDKRGIEILPLKKVHRLGGWC